MESGAILISPNVEIIKDKNGNLLDETVVVSVMTCAAPRITRGLEGMSNAEYENLLYKRITGMLKVAANYGYEYLVLGAWGCGAFGNDPEVVAEIFYKALCELTYNNMSHESLFKQIHFAILDKGSIPDLNIRKGAGTNTAKTGICTGVGVFTIMEGREEKAPIHGGGRLKNGAG